MLKPRPSFWRRCLASLPIAALLLQPALATPAHARTAPAPLQCDPNDLDGCMPLPGPQRGMQPGYTYVYQLNTVVHGKSATQNSVIADTRQNTTTLSGEAHFTAIRRQPDNTLLVQLVVREVQVKHTDESGMFTDVPSHTNWIDALAVPVYFEQDLNGAITRFMYLASDNTDALNTKRGVVAAYQVRQSSPVAQLLPSAGADSLAGEQVQYAETSDAAVTVYRKVRVETFFRKLQEAPALSDKAAAIEPAVRDLLARRGNVFLPAVSSNSVTGPRIGALQVPIDDPGDTPVPGGNNFEQNSDSQITVHNDSGVVVGVTQQQNVSTVLDGDYPETPADGNGVLSGVNSDMQLNLQRTQAATGIIAPSNAELDTIYQVGIGVPETPEDSAAPLQPTDAASAVAALREAPGSPETLHAVVNALRSDESEQVYGSKPVYSALNDDGGDPALRKTVIGALVSVGTPRAQQALIEMGLQSPALDSAGADERRRDVLIGMATLSTPSDETLSVLQRLSDDPAFTLRAQAQLTLDALINRSQGVQPDLRALSPEVTQAEVLGPHRPPLSPQATAADTINFSRVWTRRIGSGFAWGELRGEIQATSTISQPNLYLRALGTAKGHLFGFTRELARAEFSSSVVNTGTNPVTYTRQFTGLVTVFGQTVVNETFLAYGCGITRTGDLLPQYNRTFFSVVKSFQAGLFRVRLTAAMAGHVAVKYDYAIAACNAPVNASASITVTPQAWISAQGSAGVAFLWMARAGAGVSADVLRTSLPVGARGEYSLISQPHARLCGESMLTVQPLSGRMFLYAEWRRWVFFGSWRRAEWTVWRFATPAYSMTLFRECWG